MRERRRSRQEGTATTSSPSWSERCFISCSASFSIPSSSATRCSAAPRSSVPTGPTLEKICAARTIVAQRAECAGRVAAMEQRLTATLTAVQTVKPALAKFYDLLSDEQKARFNALRAGDRRHG